MASAQMLARALGLFSLGLGVVQLVAPRRFAQAIGVRPKPEAATSVRAVGLRELGAAAGLLARPMPVGFMWMRVVGDVMDLALLRRAMDDRGTERSRVSTAMAAVLGITAVDLLGSLEATREAADGSGRRKRITKAVTVLRPRDEVYRLWRDLERLPQFMHHVESVRVIDTRRSHWVAKAPLGMKVEWDAEIVQDVPGELIAWRSVEGSPVTHAGVVRFRRAPGDRGTEVVAQFEYDPPGGPLGTAIAKLSGEEPEQQASDDLRRFKQILETSEVVVSDATVGGRRLRQRPAQPPREQEVGRAAAAVA